MVAVGAASIELWAQSWGLFGVREDCACKQMVSFRSLSEKRDAIGESKLFKKTLFDDILSHESSMLLLLHLSTYGTVCVTLASRPLIGAFEPTVSSSLEVGVAKELGMEDSNPSCGLNARRVLLWKT